MTEEIERSEFDENETITKLIIDKPSDLRFHAAYLAHSKAWNNATSSETKVKLNEIILLLSKEEIGYSIFYQ